MTLKQTLHIGTHTLIAFALTLSPLVIAAHAQDHQSTALETSAAPSQDAASKDVNPCFAERNGPTEIRTFYLANVSQQNDANEIMVAIRNMLCPGTKIYLVAAQEALIVRAPADQLAIAEKIIHDLDRPRKTYRLTYTITELDGNKPIGTQHYSMVVTTDQSTGMKEGTKIPVATGSYSADNSSTQTQFQYLDIGMNFDAAVAELASGVSLKYKVEQSSLSQPVTISNVTEPVVRQTVLQGISFLSFDKPVMLGSIDVPDSTRHFDIAVVLETVK